MITSFQNHEDNFDIDYHKTGDSQYGKCLTNSSQSKTFLVKTTNSMCYKKSNLYG